MTVSFRALSIAERSGYYADWRCIDECDLNSLLLAKLENIDFTVIVFNNNGGNIFSYLHNMRTNHFERLFGTPLDLNFEHAANLYDYHYTQLESPADLKADMLNQKGRQLIEIKTDRDHNLDSHNQLKAQLKKLVTDFEF